jgi:iron complex transport system substrate-binding protein
MKLNKFTKIFSIALAIVVLIMACACTSHIAGTTTNATTKTITTTATTTTETTTTTTNPVTTTTQTTAAEMQTAYPVTIKNMTFAPTNGSTFQVVQTFTQTPTRVIVYGQDMLDRMVYFELQDLIVGVANVNIAASELTGAYIDIEKALPVISGTGFIPKEVTLNAHPDCIISYNPSVIRDQGWSGITELNSYGIKYFGLHPMPNPLTLDYAYNNLREFGLIFNVQDKVNAFIQGQQAITGAIAAQAAKETQTTNVLFLACFSNGNYYGYTSAQIVSPLITLAGGTPVLSSKITLLSVETILQMNPDVIILMPSATVTEVFAQLSVFQTLNAVKNGRVVSLPNLPYVQPNFIIGNTAIRVAQAIHPAWTFTPFPTGK